MSPPKRRGAGNPAIQPQLSEACRSAAVGRLIRHPANSGRLTATIAMSCLGRCAKGVPSKWRATQTETVGSGAEFAVRCAGIHVVTFWPPVPNSRAIPCVWLRAH